MTESNTIKPEPMPGIVPRWEWHVFGDHFDTADSILATMEPERVGSSGETYFLSRRSDASVKVRDGLMDVKQHFASDDDGLEQWAPTQKSEFPVSSGDVTSVLDALGEHTLQPTQNEYPLADLISLIESSDDLRAVAVNKERRHYSSGGCQVESTEITVEGVTTRTMVIEGTDAPQVLATVRRFGFDEHPNTSVARGLKTMAGFGSVRFAVIDVGTNSVKYHLEERQADGSAETIIDRSEVTRLGEGQDDDGVLADEPIARTVDAIVSMVADTHAHEPVEIRAVGTAGLRRAPNNAALVDAVRERCDLEVEVISGGEEARLAYLAATSALPAMSGPLAVFDSGGGSTQFTFGSDGHVDDQFSLYVGAVRVTEQFGLDGETSTTTLAEVFAWLSDEFTRAAADRRPDALVAIGGTSTNIAAVRHGLATYDPDVVQGTVIDIDELDRQIELYRTRSADERRSIPGLQPARAEVILGGACIVRTILTVLGLTTMTVSDRGLRHGVVIDRFGPKPPRHG